MIEDPDLLDALLAIGQLFGVLLLLLGAYLSTLKAVLTAKRSDESGQ